MVSSLKCHSKQRFFLEVPLKLLTVIYNPWNNNNNKVILSLSLQFFFPQKKKKTQKNKTQKKPSYIDKKIVKGSINTKALVQEKYSINLLFLNRIHVFFLKFRNTVTVELV